jgi:RNA polymerase sigma-70 factor, ECF subfamily
MTAPPRGTAATSDGERTDADLLRAHVDGDHDAFGELFARHRDRLWAVAVRTMGNHEDAADGLQDGMIAAFRRASSYRGDAAVTTWLHRVVVNACLDRLRAAKVRAADALPDDLEAFESRGSLRTSTDELDDPAERSVADERREIVLRALRTLPEEQRAALVLVDMEGYPMAEVAVMLDCAVGTVKSRCSRGRHRLAELLGDLLGPGADDPDDPDDPDDRAAGDPDHGNRPPARPVVSSDPPRGPPTTPGG